MLSNSLKPLKIGCPKCGCFVYMYGVTDRAMRKACCVHCHIQFTITSEEYKKAKEKT